MSSIDPIAVSPDQAAVRLGLGRSLTYAMLKDGRLKSVRAGRRILVPLAEIKRFLDPLERAGEATRDR
jgi:excisionase family DNA binding protein